MKLAITMQKGSQPVIYIIVEKEPSTFFKPSVKADSFTLWKQIESRTFCFNITKKDWIKRISIVVNYCSCRWQNPDHSLTKVFSNWFVNVKNIFLMAFTSLDDPLRNSIQKVEHQVLISILLHLLIRQRIKEFLKYSDPQETALNEYFCVCIYFFSP